MRDKRNMHTILVRKPEVKRALETCVHRRIILKHFTDTMLDVTHYVRYI
jgi:hypothetical protein